MSEIGVLVKVPAELHSEFKRASAQHQRSMQKVMVALLEGWIANGAPDPLSYGSSQDQRGQGSIEDSGARQALLQVAAELKDLKKRVAQLEQDEPAKLQQSLAFEAFFEALGEGVEDKGETDPKRPNFKAFYEELTRSAEMPGNEKAQQA